VLLRSDDLDRIDDAKRRVFDEMHGLFAVTSIRNGWVGGGFTAGSSLPKRMVMQARVPGAELYARHGGELFLDSTSTVK
jgi:hypothetical protein